MLRRWVILSIAAHLMGLGVSVVVAMSHRAKQERHVSVTRGVEAVELPEVSERFFAVPDIVNPDGDLPEPRGGAAVARIDTGSNGQGGDATSKERAIHLASRDESMRYVPDLLNRLNRDQEQRIRTAKTRESYEDQRSAKDPMELSFLASGKGTLKERRPEANDPSRGARVSNEASLRGGRSGTVGNAGEGAERGETTPGSDERLPSIGVARSNPGRDHRTSAAVAYGRPLVHQGAVSLPANMSGRPNDTVDSDQEVATRIRSLVHASVAGGVDGDGRGGSSGEGDPGALGDHGAGAHPTPTGPGGDGWVSLDSRDPALIGYFRQIHRKIDPLVAKAFPAEDASELRQGYVTLAFTVARDGAVRVHWPPVRKSGIPAYDLNCAQAIRDAGPFGPIPPALSSKSLTIRSTFSAGRRW